MGLFYAVPLQSTPSNKNHQADYPPADHVWSISSCISTFPGGWVIFKLKANLSSTGTGLNRIFHVYA